MAKQKYRLVGSKILARIPQGEQTSPGGIVLPAVRSDKPSRAQVVAVGPGKLLDEETDERQYMESLKPGDWFIFDDAGVCQPDCTIDGEKLWIFDIKHVVLIEE